MFCAPTVARRDMSKMCLSFHLSLYYAAVAMALLLAVRQRMIVSLTAFVVLLLNVLLCGSAYAGTKNLCCGRTTQSEINKRTTDKLYLSFDTTEL